MFCRILLQIWGVGAPASVGMPSLCLSSWSSGPSSPSGPPGILALLALLALGPPGPCFLQALLLVFWLECSVFCGLFCPHLLAGVFCPHHLFSADCSVRIFWVHCSVHTISSLRIVLSASSGWIVLSTPSLWYCLPILFSADCSVRIFWVDCSFHPIFSLRIVLSASSGWIVYPFFSLRIVLSASSGWIVLSTPSFLCGLFCPHLLGGLFCPHHLVCADCSVRIFCVDCSVHTISSLRIVLPASSGWTVLSTLSFSRDAIRFFCLNFGALRDARFRCSLCVLLYCGFFCPLAPLIWIFLSEFLELFRDARSRCYIATLGLAAISRRSVSQLYRDPRSRMDLSYRYRAPNIASSEFAGGQISPLANLREANIASSEFAGSKYRL
jgi:hypothetical protein